MGAGSQASLLWPSTPGMWLMAARKSGVHVCQLLNEARQFVEGRDEGKKKKENKGNSEEACPLSRGNKPAVIPVGVSAPDVSWFKQIPG